MKKRYLGLVLFIGYLFLFTSVQAESTSVYPPLKVWAEPSGRYLSKPQHISLQTNSEAAAGAKIFYTFDLEGSLGDLKEYMSPIYIEKDTNIWFFAITSPQEETEIQYTTYNFLENLHTVSKKVSPHPSRIYITEIAPRTGKSYSDWIEIKNYGNEGYSLDGWRVRTKNREIIIYDRFLLPKEHALVYVPLHDFNDKVELYSPENELVDRISYRKVINLFQSFARKEFANGQGCFLRLFATSHPTKKKDNIISN